jgi:hypothetical protein
MLPSEGCPQCGYVNEIDKIQIFDHIFDWFVCAKCGGVWVKSQYGDWLDSMPYHEWKKRERDRDVERREKEKSKK